MLKVILVVLVCAFLALLVIGLRKESSFSTRCEAAGGVRVKSWNGYVCVKKDALLSV